MLMLSREGSEDWSLDRQRINGMFRFCSPSVDWMLTATAEPLHCHHTGRLCHHVCFLALDAMARLLYLVFRSPRVNGPAAGNILRAPPPRPRCGARTQDLAAKAEVHDL